VSATLGRRGPVAATRSTPRRTPGRAARTPSRPTPAQVAAASGKTVPDVVAPGLAILFCGINPGLYSGAVGHHFARPGNRFWKALHAAGLTDRVLSPWDERALLEAGLGVTNIVARATASAAELSPAELQAGARRLAAKVRRHRPSWVAFLGMGAYRTAFDRPRARLGPQPESIASSRIWLLPNPSGLNASYQLPALAHALRELADAAAAGASFAHRRDRDGRSLKAGARRVD
jgi:TDG/mug DNA glycosylase family protein